MITQSKDFLNNIHRELQSFLMNNQGENDDLPEVWYAIDFEDVDNTLNEINKGNLANRPIVQAVETNIRFNDTYDTSEGKVQLIQANITLYTIINSTYEEGSKRKVLLNELSSQLKYKFDNYIESIPHFRAVKINLPDGILNRDADNVYSCRQDLYVEFYKKVR